MTPVKCRHFTECGGCSFQDIPYPKQVENKKKLLTAISGFKDVKIIESPEIYNFRNKMEYSFEGNNLGLHSKERFDKVIDLKECPIFSNWIGGFLEDVRKFALEYSIPFYERRKKRGILRYLIVRESKFTGNIMVVLVVDGNAFEYKKEWIEKVKNSIPGVTSIVLAYRHLSGDSAFTEDIEVIYGKDFIPMKAGDIILDVSPFSFFQPNSYQIDNMYTQISSKIKGNGKILDLYSGIGSIPFSLAKEGREITGVENSKICLVDARRNFKRLNPPGKIMFVETTVKNFLSATSEPYTYIVIDPPRGGMSYRVWERLMKLQNQEGKIKKIFYISCSLKNLKKDLDFLKNNTDWKICSVTGIDMFVHTPHLETIVEISVK